MKPNDLEKWVWTDADFDVMGWHDCRIHALAFSPETFELLLDIDYILKWIEPESVTGYFEFVVVPATLVFENVHGGHFDLDPSSGLQILNVTRNSAGRAANAEYIGRSEEWVWTIECAEGEMTFHSVGFKQFIRRAPVVGSTQSLPAGARGFSFSRGRTDVAG